MCSVSIGMWRAQICAACYGIGGWDPRGVVHVYGKWRALVACRARVCVVDGGGVTITLVAVGGSSPNADGTAIVPSGMPRYRYIAGGCGECVGEACVLSRVCAVQVVVVVVLQNIVVPVRASRMWRARLLCMRLPSHVQHCDTMQCCRRVCGSCCGRHTIAHSLRALPWTHQSSPRPAHWIGCRAHAGRRELQARRPSEGHVRCPNACVCACVRACVCVCVCVAVGMRVVAAAAVATD